MITGSNIFIEVLAWVGVVFVAGFIGYFGRHLSKMLIARIQRRKIEQNIQNAQLGSFSTNPPITQQYKVEKKKAKAEEKKLKKQGKI